MLLLMHIQKVTNSLNSFYFRVKFQWHISVKIITAAVDPEISPDYRIMPGLGNFGDRYFGTTTPEQEPIRPTHRSPIHHNRPVFNELGSDSSFMEL